MNPNVQADSRVVEGHLRLNAVIEFIPSGWVVTRPALFISLSPPNRQGMCIGKLTGWDSRSTEPHASQWLTIRCTLEEDSAASFTA